jgi:CRISPR-associated endonuclease/helicase Cas3
LATRSTALRHDLDAPEAIHDWFEQVYWTTGEKLDRHGIVQGFVCGRAEVSFPYRTTAEVYRMVDSTMVPVIIPTDSNAANLDRLGVAEVSSGRLARALQPYTVQIPTRDRALLRANGRGDFAAPHLRSDQFFVLTDKTLYQEGSGLWWEGADQLAEGQWNV